MVFTYILGDTLGGVLVGTVPTERGTMVLTTGKQPVVQPFGSRGGHTKRQSQPSGGRHTRAERDFTKIPDHQR